MKLLRACVTYVNGSDVRYSSSGKAAWALAVGYPMDIAYPLNASPFPPNTFSISVFLRQRTPTDTDEDCVKCYPFLDDTYSTTHQIWSSV